MDFEELFREHRADVERFVKFRLPSAADAEDVLQESFFAAFLQFPSLKGKKTLKHGFWGLHGINATIISGKERNSGRYP